MVPERRLRSLQRWRRMMLRTFVVMARTIWTTVEAALISLRRTPSCRNQISDQQVECTHPRSLQYNHGNRFGSGVYCGRCKLRLQYQSNTGETSLTTLHNPLCRDTRNARSTSSATSASATSRRATATPESQSCQSMTKSPTEFMDLTVDDMADSDETPIVGLP
jgi:hypothetical protein